MEIRDTISDMLVEKLKEVPGWMERASCSDTDLDPFFDEHKDDFLKLCSECPVIKQCEDKFKSFNDEVRPIENGVFHGHLYTEG